MVKVLVGPLGGHFAGERRTGRYKKSDFGFAEGTAFATPIRGPRWGFLPRNQPAKSQIRIGITI